MRTTRTYAELPISPAAYDEIAGKLRAADYHHAFIDEGDGVALDMHGIGLTREAGRPIDWRTYAVGSVIGALIGVAIIAFVVMG